MPQERSPRATLEGLTVVIAARNEEHSLPRCLDSILRQSPPPAGLEVIVVANNCSDRTADAARAMAGEAAAIGVDLVVIEVFEGGKHLALNCGDSAANNPARAYVDADVLLSGGTIAAAREALLEFHLVAPRLQVLRPSTSLGRSYAAVWERSPAVKSRVIGCGFYAVSGSGRSRWDTFPDIISDDTYVRLHFERGEQAVLQGESVLLSLPAKARELLLVRGRWCRGNRQVHRLFPDLVDRERRGLWRSTYGMLLRTPSLWRHVPGAGLVFVCGKLLALAYSGVGAERWETATSSSIRSAPGPAIPVQGGLPSRLAARR
ncbi:MAG: glycosyltransferase family 2 protein [Actinomycetota bacterium]